MQLNVKNVNINVLKVYRPMIFSEKMKDILRNITIKIKSDRLKDQNIKH